MYDRYNIELDENYLDNICTFQNRAGMFPTIEMLETYNELHSNPSIIPDTANSRIRALFAELIPNTANDTFVALRFRKLCGYKNLYLPLSKRYPTLSELNSFISNITYTHDILNYDKFARMIYIIAHQENIPVDFEKYEKWSIEKTDTPNETVTTENETSKTSTINDTVDNDGTVTKVTAHNEDNAKTGTEATARTGTDTTTLTKTGTIGESTSNTERLSGSDITDTDIDKSLNETKTEKIAPFDSASFNNDTESTTYTTESEQTDSTVSYGKVTTDTGTKTTTNNTTDTEQVTHLTTDTTTYNINDTKDIDITDTTTTDTTTERTATTTDSGELTETKTRTGENEAAENGERWINSGLSLEELINRENKLLPIFDVYLMSIAKEISLNCIDDVW